ncbi:hypothetical protein [Actinacidiphila glaucinigra]|uniref:hypothetical protein n=1 Tax=Actinacidiphila glaucinigra TaxID=235986 RepID=UPI002E351E2B|nr:hypothetical protein [Actinacidiphila glaucinigra]
MPGTHFAPRPPEEELAAPAIGTVDDLARRLARHALRRLTVPGTAADIDGTRARGEALAYLHMLNLLHQAIAHLEKLAAEQAAAASAAYPQIGRPCNISRQGARRRWPGLVTSDTPHRPPRRTDRTRSQ